MERNRFHSEEVSSALKRIPSWIIICCNTVFLLIGLLLYLIISNENIEVKKSFSFKTTSSINHNITNDTIH